MPAHVLRFWESRFSQVRPMKKGGGRRYYRPEDIALLRGIRARLYDDGLSIKDVQAQIRTQGVASIAAAPPGGQARTRPARSAPPASEPVEDSEAALAQQDDTRERLGSALESLLAAREKLNKALQ